MTQREFPESPLVGVGGLVIHAGRALLVRRGTEPAQGEWSIPGGLLEAGETLHEGVTRELREETGVTVRVIDLIEALERIFWDPRSTASAAAGLQEPPARPRYHYVILDFLCELVEGEPRVGDEITAIAFAGEDELAQYDLHPTVTRVLRKGFAMARARAAEHAKD